MAYCSINGCINKSRKKGYCETHYQRILKRGSPDLPETKPLSERFWEKVNKNDIDKCWEWTGACSKGGYGHISVNRKLVQATHFSYFLEHGKWPPPNMLICHTCDNRRCVNPAHLFVGTQMDNIHDMIAKGRQACGRKKK